MLVVGSKIKLKKKMGAFDNIGEICEVTDILEGGVICFKFGGCHLGCMSYDEYEKYFEKVEDAPVKRTWSEWERRNNIVLTLDKQRCGFSYSVRTNGKKVQLKIETGKNDTIRSEASCNKNDKFDFNKGLELAKRRLIVKFLAKKVEDYAKLM